MKTENRRINIYINADEAGRSMDKLAKSSDLARAKLQKLQEAGKALDAEGLPTDEARALQEQLEKNAQKAQLLADQINGKVAPSLKQLKTQSGILRRELEQLPEGTQEFIDKTKQLQQVEARIKAVTDEIKDTRTNWQKLKDDFKTFGLFAGATVAGEVISNLFASVQQFFAGAIDNAAKLSDELADIRKTTGMTQEEVEKLNSELSKLNTRTSSADLRGIARIGGQLGIANKELLGFVENVDKAVVALGDEFTGGAEEVAKEIGSLQKLFKETRNLEAGQAINEIGSALNELGSAGSATAPSIAEFTKRMGALGGFAPKITETLGLGAAMEELGLSAEISSGGISNIILTMARSPQAFGQFIEKSGKAGISAKQFAELVKKDTNGALLALAKTLAGEDNASVAKALEDLKIGSQESVKAMSLLANQTDFVREKQALAAQAMREASSLTDEFNVKNENFAASLEKAEKFISKIVAGLTKPFVLAVAGAADIVNQFNELTTGKPQQDFSNGLREQISLLEKRKLQFNAEMQVLREGNLSKAEREKLMKNINEKYKDLIDFQITDQTNERDLARLQDQVNEKLKERIALRMREAEITEKVTKVIALEKQIQEEQARITDLRIKEKTLPASSSQKVVSGPGYVSTAATQLAGVGDAQLSERDNLTNSIRAGQSRISQAQKEIEALQKSINKTDEIYRKVIGNITKPVSNTAASYNSGTGLPEIPDDKELEKKLEEQARKIKEAADAEMRLLEENAKRRVALIENEFARRRAEANRQADEDRRRIAESAATEETKAAAIRLTNEKLLTDLQRIDKEEVKSKKEAQAKKFAAVQERIQKELQIIQREAKSKAELDVELAEATGNTDAILSAKLLQLETEKMLELQNKDLTESEKLLIEERYRKKSIDLVRQAELQKAELMRQYAMLGVNIATEFVALTSQLEMNQAEKTKQERLDVLNAQLEQGLLSTEQYEAQKASIEQGFALETAEIKTRAARAEKMAKIAEATINGALAVLKAAPNIPLQIATGALAALQIAKIVATPIPDFAAEIKSGGSSRAPRGGYKDGGFTDEAPSDNVVVGDVHANEYVVPAWLLDVPEIADMVSVIEAARVQGRVSDRSTTPAASGSSATPQTSESAAAIIAELRAMREELSTWQSKLEVIFVYRDFEEFQAKQVTIQNLTTL